ncbi:MAG: type II toxin-antitoxin system HicB family antitoxin [Meiothermus silvanus]|nr:type II toxin-antitoxin system HicB family antitoxin [Allomeiothermus silvanus]
MRQYTVLVYEDPEDPGKWLAEFPAVRGAHSWGRSPEEAVENAKEAFELVLEVLLEDGKPLPDDVQTMRVEVKAA